MQNRAAPVAVFDLDGTITFHDTLRLVLRRGLSRFPARPFAAMGLPADWRAARRDVAARGAFKARMLNILFGGRSRAWMEAFAADFAQDLLGSGIKPGAHAAIARHRATGDRLVLATASPILWARPIGEALGFDAVLATHLAWEGEGFAGRLDGPNLLHEEKRLAVLAWMAREAEGAAPHAAYTDHHHDLPMLLLAEHPVAVDPTPALAAEARTRGIPVEHWG
jgi:HAD superfamily hydrolase (TIGR01490 family)